MALNRRQQVFIEEYLNCWNASEAARRAGYSVKTAGKIGQENLLKPEISVEVERLIAERGIKPPEVLQRLAAQARGDIGDLFVVTERWTRAPLPSDNVIDERETVDAKGKLIREYLAQRTHLDLAKLKDPAYSRLIRKFSDTRNGVSVEMYDAQAALEKIGKALGVLKENVNVSNEGPLEVVTRIVKRNDAAS